MQRKGEFCPASFHDAQALWTVALSIVTGRLSHWATGGEYRRSQLQSWRSSASSRSSITSARILYRVLCKSCLSSLLSTFGCWLSVSFLARLAFQLILGFAPWLSGWCLVGRHVDAKAELDREAPCFPQPCP
jgi:hypothetical protein